MTYCGHCGAPLHGDEKFCVVCGTAVSAVAPVSAPAQAAQPPVSTPVATVASPVPPGAAPGAYAVPYPVAVGAPAVAAKSGGKKWTWIVVLVLAAGAYSYYSRNQAAPAPAAGTPPAAGAPPAAGTPPASGAPPANGTAPADGTAPGQPGVQPNPAGLLPQQSFAGHWKAIYGNVEVTNGAWTNHSVVAVQSVVLQCDQYASNGADLSQARMTLNGPVRPGGTVTFDPFPMGRVNVYMSKVNCAIVAVTPAG